MPDRTPKTTQINTLSNIQSLHALPRAKDGDKYVVTAGAMEPGKVIKVPGKAGDAEIIHVREIIEC